MNKPKPREPTKYLIHEPPEYDGKIGTMIRRAHGDYYVLLVEGQELTLNFEKGDFEMLD